MSEYIKSTQQEREIEKQERQRARLLAQTYARQARQYAASASMQEIRAGHAKEDEARALRVQDEIEAAKIKREQDELKVGDQARPPPSAPHSALRPPPSTLTFQVLEVGGVSLGGSKLSEHVPAGRTRMTLTILRRCTCCSWKDGVRVPGGGAGSAQE